MRFATAFPLTRPVARRRAGALFDLCAGFVYSQVLLAFVRLRAAEVLAEGPRTVAELAPRLGLPADGAARLLRAAAALDLAAERGGGRYGLGPLGAPLLGNPGIAAMVEHHVLLYADLADPVALLRQRRTDTGLAGYWAYAGAERPAEALAGDVDPYTALMAATQPLVAAEVLDAWPVHKHRRLLDVGGGDGSFLRATGQRAPGLELVLFDLPAVAARAQERFESEGLGGRARAEGGDFHTDALPGGADLVTLVRVLHDHDDGDVLALLKAVRRAIHPTGTLLVAEPMAGSRGRGARAMGDAYFGFYLLAMGRGRPRTPAELSTLLVAAGFQPPRPVRTRTPLLASLLAARPDRA
ncbi:methyltransferase [Aerophototrophica crusticola]|uniref:Methyltransferase n=2 Tax=Aerophototrophica crusticola TaxID=1709002 RepID=A0A858RC79_9PROT|nr:methyltransferase [Rhodospirillaceae bacterium B3]